MKIYNEVDIVDDISPNLSEVTPLVITDMFLLYGQVFIVKNTAYKVLRISNHIPRELVWAIASELPDGYQQFWTQDVPVTVLKYTRYVTCPFCGAIDYNTKKVQNSNYYCGYCDSDFSYKRKNKKYFSTPLRKSSAIVFDNLIPVQTTNGSDKINGAV